MLTFAIGDVHGCAYEFETMINEIAKYADGREYRVITLGDYIDRGPNSKLVLDILMAFPEFIKLRGNHEGMLLDAAAGDQGAYVDFLYNGGMETYRSFGVEYGDDIPDKYIDGDIPAKYIDLLRYQTRFYFEDDLRVFVHAGIDPYFPDMTRQREFTMTWVREPFLEMNAPFFKYVVHGHTPLDNGKPDIRHNRCNLDTYCFAGGPLTCGVFDDTQAKPIDIIQVSR